MKIAYARYMILGSLLTTALFLTLALPAGVEAIGLYSFIARAEEADVHIVILMPDEETRGGDGTANERIRFTCDINYRLPGRAPNGDIERRGLVVTDRFIGLVTVTGNRLPEKVSVTGREGEKPHPIGAVWRFISKRLRRYSTLVACCLKALMIAAWNLAGSYFG